MRYFWVGLVCVSAVLSCSETKSNCADCGQNLCPATTDVSIKDFKFDPACITIAAGDTVTFTNDGAMTHTVTEDSGPAFDSGDIAPNGNFAQLFSTAETVGAHCAYHPAMTIEIRVE